MALCYPDGHPKPKCTIFFKILNFIVLAVGVAIFAVGIYVAATSPAVRTFAIIIVIVGVCVAASSLLGLFGSAFGMEETSGRYYCLAIFWFISLVAGVILIVLGAVLMTSPETIESYVIIVWESIQKTLDELKLGEKNTKIVQDLISNMTLLGGFSIGVGVYLLFAFVVSCYLLGFDKFIITTLFLGSVAISVLGGLIIAICAYFMLYVDIIADQLTLMIAGIVLGGVILVLGLYGVITACYFQKKTWPIRIYFILLFLIALAMLIIGVVGFMYTETVKEKVRETLEDKCKLGDGKMMDTSSCNSTFTSILLYLCDNKLAPDTTDLTDYGEVPGCKAEAGDDTWVCKCVSPSQIDGKYFPRYFDAVVVKLEQSAAGNIKILGIIGLCAAAFLCYMVISSFIYCCCIAPKYRDE